MTLASRIVRVSGLTIILVLLLASSSRLLQEGLPISCDKWMHKGLQRLQRLLPASRDDGRRKLGPVDPTVGAEHSWKRGTHGLHCCAPRRHETHTTTATHAYICGCSLPPACSWRG